MTGTDTPGTSASAADLAVEAEKLEKLAGDLDTMQEVLRKQLLRMDRIVDGIEARWQGPASQAYRTKHRAAAEDAVRIRKTMKLFAKAVRLSKDGFTAQELEVLAEFRRLQARTGIEAEVDALSTPNTAPTSQAGPRSRIADL
ncbi:WXG100 family type VII secretion target [Streptomyces sp. BPSDS2]|uniref:WXG100 family type VII secretion target n=1 Tax=Streptomyces sp. BPSDS2 TaxID=2571021 RepID=UPI001F0F1D3A|nr:WXG100 family type VII secretion target [Streptomyces sp. BPSDS2]